MRRIIFAGLLVVFLIAGAGIAALTSGSSRPAGLVAGASASARPTGGTIAGSSAGAGAATASPGDSAAPTDSPVPTATPKPTPTSRLTGLPTTAAKAKRHVIAVMIDDHWDARPQSGFNQAGIVWQALAEGGIPRYMLIFQDGDPSSIGPVRSSREYFLQWATEWRAIYVHAGGSTQALASLRKYGTGQWVYNADDFRWEGKYLWRITTRKAPHNVYTDSKNLRALGKKLGAKDITAAPLWTFAADGPLAKRPKGGRIAVNYKYDQILYKYDKASNTYKRFTGGKPQIDAADKTQVAPKNVVVMVVKFGPLNDGHPEKGRLEAQIIGSGTAWVSTNGVTIKGTWKKTSVKGPTRFYDKKGRIIPLTAGQTFVQVIPKSGDVVFTKGTPPASSAPTPSPSPSTAP